MHEFVAGQDTQNSWPVGITGFGLGVIDHPPAGGLAGAAEAPIRMIALAAARQAAARPATTGAVTPRARCGSIADGRGRCFPVSLIGWCRDRAAIQPVQELRSRMMTPQVRSNRRGQSYA
jgi:hypothetical protein